MYRVMSRLETPDKVYEPGDTIMNYDFYELHASYRHHFQYFDSEKPIPPIRYEAEKEPVRMRNYTYDETEETPYLSYSAFALIISILMNIYLLVTTIR